MVFLKLDFVHPFSIAFKNEVFEINNEVEVFATPGHTLDSVSVKVKSADQGVIVIAGDLFEKFEDLKDDSIWKDAGSEDPELQAKNREKVLKMADFVIPGHGAMFPVSKSMLSNVS